MTVIMMSHNEPTRLPVLIDVADRTPVRRRCRGADRSWLTADFTLLLR
jgi:hypothetical protein